MCERAVSRERNLVLLAAFTLSKAPLESVTAEIQGRCDACSKWRTARTAELG